MENDIVEPGSVYLRLDGYWDMDDLSQLSRQYVQCYALVFSLSGFESLSDDEARRDWFQGAYNKYPWRGGYSAVNFYRSIYSKVPYELRPNIEEIQFASPGHIKLKEVVIVAGMLAAIVAATCSSINQVNDTYNAIRRGITERKLSQIEVKKAEIELNAEQKRFVSQSKAQLIKQMQIPPVMCEELRRRASKNDLMELKILMSFHRRVRDIADMQVNGMVKLEDPNGNGK